ncbi:MAG TPA: hypothetical protein VGG65_00885 [Thermoanaerobaculia bacterium]
MARGARRPLRASGVAAVAALAAAAACLIVPGPAGPIVERAGGALAATAVASSGQPPPIRTPEAMKEPEPLEVEPDGASVDALVRALYAAVSHGPDGEPNWTRLRALFLPRASIVPPKRPDADGFTVLDPAGFEARIRAYIAGRRERHEPLGFTEREIGRRESRFGHVCQVFSAYETVRAPGDAVAFARGIHSIQLVSDGRRWWIAALAWDGERPDNPMPQEWRVPEVR